MSFLRPAPHDRQADTPANGGSPSRPLLLALCLAAVTALGGILAGPVAASSRAPQPGPTGDRSVDIPYEADVRLELTPVGGDGDEPIWLGDSRSYTATAIVAVGPDQGGADNPDAKSYSVDVTGRTRFTVTQEGAPSGRCRRASCTPATVGDHTVKGGFARWPGRLVEATTTLRVRQPVERLRLDPGNGRIAAGDGQRYTAMGSTDDGRRPRDVTGDTRFTVTPARGTDIPCQGALCAPTTAGNYTVTGTLEQKGRDPVTGTATLTVVPGAPTTLRMDPTGATVKEGVEQAFQAIAGDRFGNERNLTERARFTIVRVDSAATEGGSCARSGERVRCKAATPGIYRVTAALRAPRLSATATLTVLPPEIEIEPSIRVDPRSASPNTQVVASGTTGSCGRVGTLTLERTKVRMRVRGDFTARFTVPSGASPGSYKVWLDVICDNQGERVSGDLEVTNQPPQAVDDPDAATLRDHAVLIPVTDNDSDPDDPDGYETSLEAGTPAHGTAGGQGDRHVRYTPAKGFTGTDRFRYDLCDIVDAGGTRQCGTATVTVTVSRPEPKPVDDPDVATVRDQPVVIDVMGNDRHPDPSRLRVRRPERPGAGAEKLADGTVRYTPEPGHVGRDTFRYDYCGSAVNVAGTAACPSATVTVTVRPPGVQPKPTPEPVDDADEATTRDQPVVIDVMGNDRNPDPARLRVRDQPAEGDAERLPDGAVEYTPEEGFTGTDRFTYDYCRDASGVTGRTACPAATVTVDVAEPSVDPEPEPQPDPQPVDDPGAATVRDRPVVLDVMGNDRHPDPARLRVKDRPAGGQAEKLADGSLRYTPRRGFVGTDSFTYDYCGPVVDADRQAACPAATVTVTVTSTPVVASIRPGSAAPGTAVEVAGNTGSCNRAGTLSLKETGVIVHVTGDQRSSFTARLAIPKATAPRAYTLELSVDCQGQAQRAEGRVTVTNQAPVAADDVHTTTRDHAVLIPVTANDRDPDDPDGYPTRLLASAATNGSTEVRSDEAIAYTPGTGFVGQDQFQYSLCDDILNAAGRADCGTATVTVNVTDTPVITSVSPGSTKPGTPVVVVGSTGSCNGAGRLTLEETGVGAQVVAEQNGNFVTAVTIPNGTFPRDYRLVLRVDCNGRVQQAEATLSVTNEPPETVDDVADTISGTSVPIEVTGNDNDPDDPDGYPSRLLVSSQPGNGTAEVQSERTILYTPRQGFVGRDRFRYSLCDDTLNAAGRADCGTATVTVTVSDAGRCQPAGDVPSFRVDPGKGRGGARLGITATVDRKLAACPFRLLFGGTPLGDGVRAGDDGGITAQRAVPDHVKPGTIPVRLATMRGQVLTEVPFEIVGPAPWRNPLVRFLLGAAALLAGALARAAFRRWWPTGAKPATGEPPGPAEAVRVEPHTSPVEVAVERVREDGTHSLTVRLEPRHDPGTQSLEEADR